MKHLATYLLLKLGGNPAPTADDVAKALQTVGVAVDKEKLEQLIVELEGKDIDEIMETGKKMLAWQAPPVVLANVNDENGQKDNSGDIQKPTEDIHDEPVLGDPLDVGGVTGIFGDAEDGDY